MKKYILIFLTVSVFACSKKEIIGPNIEDFGFSPVITSALTASDDTLDFSLGETVYFNAAFENDVVWKISVAGATTHAEKTFTGSGKVINLNNSLWNGTPDNPPVFLQENVTAVLSFPNFPSAGFSSVQLHIKQPKGTDQGILISDFSISKVGAGWNSDWPATFNNNSSYSYPDGNNYMVMQGTPWQANNPYIDYLSITPSQADTDYGIYFPLYVNPEQVYFNIMVYNTGTEYTWFNINIKEENGATRELTLKPDWVGWKLISVNYNDLVSTSANAATPDKITEVTFLLFSDEDLSNASLSEVSVAFDHPIFTHNYPYQP